LLKNLIIQKYRIKHPNSADINHKTGLSGITQHIPKLFNNRTLKISGIGLNDTTLNIAPKITTKTENAITGESLIYFFFMKSHTEVSRLKVNISRKPATIKNPSTEQFAYTVALCKKEYKSMSGYMADKHHPLLINMCNRIIVNIKNVRKNSMLFNFCIILPDKNFIINTAWYLHNYQ
jgi:hypothetical protein